MKKTKKTDTTNSTLLVVTSVAVVVLGVAALFLWLRPTTFQSRTTNVAEKLSYGPMGYGRGQMGMVAQQNQYQNQTNQLNAQNCLMDGCLVVEDSDYPVAQLDEKTIGFLQDALADERKARATYEAVIAQFGSIRPFINIIRAEEQHIAMVKALFDKYGVSIPQDTTTVGVLPESFAEACQIGVDAEIANDALYQKMIPQIAQEDIKTVFTSLAAMSLQMHLPAFERCAR